MIDFKFNTDLVIENGDLAVVSGSDAIAQRIRDRLLTFSKEWFLDLSFGVPYYDNILVKNPRLDVVNAILKTQILKSQEGSFVSFLVNLDQSRNLTVEYELDTTFGVITDMVAI